MYAYPLVGLVAIVLAVYFVRVSSPEPGGRWERVMRRTAWFFGLTMLAGCALDPEPACGSTVVLATCAPAFHGTVVMVDEPDGGVSCLPGPCEVGWADCDGNPENGCEADLTLPDHCGACGNVCSASQSCKGSANTAVCL